MTSETIIHQHGKTYTTGIVHRAVYVGQDGYAKACGGQYAWLSTSDEIDAMPITCKRCA